MISILSEHSGMIGTSSRSLPLSLKVEGRRASRRGLGRVLQTVALSGRAAREHKRVRQRMIG